METRSTHDTNTRSIRDRISPHYHQNGQLHSNQHQSSSSSFCPENIVNKSDSPSRKRRRISRMQSQSPPIIWEQRRSPRHQLTSINQPQQGSPPIRRPRYREQHRLWDNNQSVYQQTSQQQQQPHLHPQSHQHQLHSQSHNQHQQPGTQSQAHLHSHPPQLMVDINQVPVSLPISHDHQIWTTYTTGAHISICQGHPGATHIPPCQVHGMYSQPFGQNCAIGQHFSNFSTTPATTITVQPQQSHYQHTHIPQQRTDSMTLDSLDHHHHHHHHPNTSPIHVAPLTTAHIHSSQQQMTSISPPQPIFISTDGRPNQIELITARTSRRSIATPRRNFTRFHWAGHPASHSHHHRHHHPVQHHQTMGHHQAPTPMQLQTPSGYQGILLNFL